MNRSKSLLKNTFILGIGKLFSKVLVFIMVPLYSRWLSTGDYGTFDLYTTYISLLVPLLTLSCGEAVFRYLLDADENFDKKRIISSGFAIIFVSSIIGFLIVCCYFVKNQRGMMIPFVIYLLADSLYSFLTAYLRGIKKISLYAISSIICVFSTFIFVTALVYFCGFGLIGIIYGYALAYCLSALFIIIKTRFFEYISFDMIKILEVKRLLKYSAPLVPNSISWWIVNGSHIWKETGWNSIIYLATIAGISPELYEAAFMDGANRIQNMRYITLPGIKSTFIILMIMNLGFILNAGFEVQYLLGNGIVLDVSETIDIFVLKYGIAENDFSFATAAGMFKSVVSIIMISLSNFLAGKLGEEKLL